MNSNSERLPKIYLFNSRYERILYVLLFSFILTAIGEVAGWYSLPTLREQWVSLLVFFFFFNALHVFLTFTGVLVVPEMRAWLREQFRPKRFIVFGPVLAVILFFGCLGVTSVGRSEVADGILTSTLVLLISLHNLSQTKGISILYNRTLRPFLSDAEVTKQAAVERLERRLFTGMLVIWIVRSLVANMMPAPPYFFLVTQIMFVAGALAVVLNALRYPQCFRTNKFFYLQGIWLFVAITFKPHLMMLQMAIHGLEYVFLSDVAFRRSAKRFSRSIIAVGAAMLLALTLIKTLDPRMFYYARFFPKFWISTLVIFSIFTEYGHYYLDSIMFRFGDPEVRENVAPLLIPPASDKAAST